MTNEKAKRIAYAINKQCSEFSLKEWCEEWEITIDEFREFLESAINYVEWEEEEKKFFEGFVDYKKIGEFDAI